jgi:hypothetical protein
MSQVLGAICQVGYVVRDIDAAIEQWIALGVGPWFYREQSPMTRFSYYGKVLPADGMPHLSIALANSGDVQIELIQQRNDAPSLYKDMLDAGAEGVQHVAYWTEDQFDEFSAFLLARGFEEGHAGQIGSQGRFGYFVNKSMPGTVIELSETKGGKRERFDAIRAASRGWDGSDPIRKTPPAPAKA